MSTEENFLVRYGLHNFVTSTLASGRQVFLIKSKQSQDMISHAMYLIKGKFGDNVDIKLV